MKLRPVLLSTILSISMACAAQAASTLTTIGNHPFHKPPLENVDDLRNMMQDNGADIERGLSMAGYPELAQPLREQFPNADIKAVEYPNGTTFEWMFYRTNGQGGVKVAKDLTWGGDATVPGFEFVVASGDTNYTFAVPAGCGNLALLGAAAKPVAKAVTCDDCPPECKDNPENCPPECQQLDCYPEAAGLPFQWIADLGLLHQRDPADYWFGRIGGEFPISETFSVVGLVGYADRYDGDDGGDALILDVFAQYNQPRWWAGLGLGGWIALDDDDYNTYYPESNDSGLDLLANVGVRVYGAPDAFNVSLFLEARSAIDELGDFSDFGRYGGGIRFEF